MDAKDMAAAIAWELDDEQWTAHAEWDEIVLTNENGERFRLTVEKIVESEE